DADGYHAGRVADIGAGTSYRFRLDGGALLVPDPASRFQPQGPHGDSEVIDPSAFEWTDAEWTGVAPEGQVIYEMHIGTFTQEGTFEGAREQLRALKDAGITLLELLPVADFPG